MKTESGMNAQNYVLETDRLLLLRRSIEDLEVCLNMDRDPEVTQYVPGPWAEPVKHREFVTARIEAKYPDGLGYWSVFERSKPTEFLGWVLLLPYSNEDNMIEIGWRFVRRSWGHGFAKESSRRILDLGKQHFPNSVIVADIHPSNSPSIRVAQKIGLRFVREVTVACENARRYQAS